MILKIIIKNHLVFYTQNLRDILNESVPGQLLMAYYDSTLVMESHMRFEMMSCIVQFFYNKSMKLGKEEFEVLANKIVDLFPTEVLSYYYQPPDESSLKHKGAIATKYYNYIQKIKKMQHRISKTDF